MSTKGKRNRWGYRNARKQVIDRKYLPEEPFESISGAEEAAERLGLHAPEDMRAAKIIYNELSRVKKGSMKPKNIMKGNSGIDKIGRAVAKECNVTYDGPGMSMGRDNNELRRVDMFFVPDRYAKCLKATDKGSEFRKVSLYYSPKKRAFFY